jgi:S-formylglutathione hydrolase FrmB
MTSGYQGMKLQSEMDSLIAKGLGAEMIVVVPNGRNAYLGSFYTNSVTTGNWEDYIYRDVVSFIDGRYRTIAKSSSRGIAGHSMGGYGAFTIAMKHPDVFGATYALSPCCIGLEGDIAADNPVWSKAAKITSRDLFARQPQSFDDFFTVAMIATSAAFSPNKDRAPLYVDFPYVPKNGVLARNEPAYSSYREKMPLYNVERYRDNLMKLRGIFLDVGEYDEFTHIRRATAMLSAELSEREIPHSFELYAGGDHRNKIRERFNTKVIPFFTAVLEK